MNAIEIKPKIEQLLETILERRNAFLVELQARAQRGKTVIQAFIDTDRGITIEECAEISRELSRMLDVTEPGLRSHQLEISSPGLDKPLRLLRQYHKNIGRCFRVRYKQVNEVVELRATLEAVTDDVLTFSPNRGERLLIPFSAIVESREELPW